MKKRIFIMVSIVIIITIIQSVYVKAAINKPTSPTLPTPPKPPSIAPSIPLPTPKSPSGKTNETGVGKISLKQSEGGKIVNNDYTKTAMIIPEKGYAIADVTIDGKSIGAVEEYKFTDNKNHLISSTFVKTSEIPYYIQNGENIYLGFSAILGNIYKYNAPNGVDIKFRENKKEFVDNTTGWAKTNIEFVTEREILFGTNQNEFSPEENMTRAMFVTLIGRLYESLYGNNSIKSNFIDVNDNAYYEKYIVWANEKGIIKGVGENRFEPNDNITREQMAAIMLNFATLLNKVEIKYNYIPYSDNESISPWAINGVKYCQETKILTGKSDGKLDPQGSATRAEVAAVIERFIKTILK